MKSLITGLIVAAFISPAFAQTATEFYVVHDTSTKKCTVVDKRPTVTTTTVVVVDGKGYKTKVEAETAMKTAKVCA
jgi:hypothetical protein